MTLAFPKPPRRRENKKYLAWIDSLPCCRCGRPPVSEHHHVRLGHHGGMGRRPDDDKALPLCHQCHIETLHRHGEEEFWGSISAVNALIAQYNLTYEHIYGEKP